MHDVPEFRDFALDRILEIVQWDDKARWKQTAKYPTSRNLLITKAKRE
jgi:hypothetical protein